MHIFHIFPSSSSSPSSWSKFVNSNLLNQSYVALTNIILLLFQTRFLFSRLILYIICVYWELHCAKIVCYMYMKMKKHVDVVWKREHCSQKIKMKMKISSFFTTTENATNETKQREFFKISRRWKLWENRICRKELEIYVWDIQIETVKRRVFIACAHDDSNDIHSKKTDFLSLYSYIIFFVSIKKDNDKYSM